MALVPQQFASSALAQGGEVNMEAAVKQVMATYSAEAVQTAGKALLDELEADKKARLETMTKKVDDVLSHASEVLIKAQKTQELDGILDDLQKLQVPQGGMNGYDPETQALTSRVSAAYQFVAQWQDYLSYLGSGNIQEAQNTLRNLVNSRSPGEALLVPRSEILARTVALASPTKKAASDASPSAPAQPTETSVLAGIKTLDDMEPTLRSLKSVSNQSYDLNQLSQMIAVYADSKNGLPITLDWLASNNGANSSPELERVKSLLLIYLLPRYIGSNALTPNPGETVNDYLKRSIETVESKQDWVSLQRIIEAETKLAKTQVYPSGTQSFLAGLNQETAGQYAMAVTSYQTALRNPDDYLPAKLVGDRLAEIKKDHPTEFEEGEKRYLNPPTPSYANPYMMMRPGMPGYGYPVSGYPNPAAMQPATSAASSGASATTVSATTVAPQVPTVSTNAAPTMPAPVSK